MVIVVQVAPVHSVVLYYARGLAQLLKLPPLKDALDM
jgi:hypothetical protein